MSVYIATASGQRLDLLNPDPSLVTLEEIADSLSREGRFHNKTSIHYSVAQHCLEVSALCTTWEGKIWGLLHDASDAYHRDLATNLKNHPTLQGFWKGMEMAWLQMFAKKYSLKLPMPSEVKSADRMMLTIERLALLPDTPEVDAQFSATDVGYSGRALAVMTAMTARERYINEFNNLMTRRPPT